MTHFFGVSIPAILAAALLVLPAGAVAQQTLAQPVAGLAAQDDCLEQPVTERSGSAVQGSARLCFTAEEVRPELQVEHLSTGTAYTTWFVYYDRAMACKTQPCVGATDAVGDDPVGVLGRMDGVVADDAGAARFSADFRGLRLSSGSEVQIPVFGHGLASTSDGRARARQLLTPQLPMLGAPGLSVVADGDLGGPVAAVIFDIP
jgi:hypothetical protein